MTAGMSVPVDAPITVVLPSVLQPLAGGQSILTAPAEKAVTVKWLLDTVTGDYPAFSRRLRDETGTVRRHVNIYVNGNEIRRLQGVATYGGARPGGPYHPVCGGRLTPQATRQTAAFVRVDGFAHAADDGP